MVGKNINVEDIRVMTNQITNYFGGKSDKFKNCFLTPKEGPDPGAYDWTKNRKLPSFDYKKSKVPKQDQEVVGCKVIKCGDQTRPSFNSYTPAKKNFKGFNES
jgi:hypothetical protein